MADSILLPSGDLIEPNTGTDYILMPSGDFLAEPAATGVTVPDESHPATAQMMQSGGFIGTVYR